MPTAKTSRTTDFARSNAQPSLRSRIRACLYGVALGDAIGAPVEKLTAAEIRERYGRVTTLAMDWFRKNDSEEERQGRIRGHGIVTDDTLMTICLMELYGKAPRHLDAWDMATEMVRRIGWERRWVPELQRETQLMERLFYPEKWIFIRHQLSPCEPREGGIGNMVNCGAAMYIAPVGLANACDPRAAYDEAINFASGHQHSYGLEAAGVMAAAVAAALIPDTDIDQIVKVAIELAKDGTRAAISDIADAAVKLRDADHATMTSAFHEVIGRYSSMGDNTHRHPAMAGIPTDNYRPSRLRAIEELPIALGFCLANRGEFRKSVLDGVNSGRDTDSIGSMVGAILGALHGESVIETADLEMLNSANRLDLTKIADGFHNIVQQMLEGDRRRTESRDRHRQALQGAE